MPDSVRGNEPDTHRSDERCAGVRGCATDLPAHGVRVCGCVYTAHHTPVLTTTENPARCAEPKTRTPNTDPEPVGPLAEKFLDRLAAQADPDLAARRRLVLDRLARQHTNRAKEQQP